jgi:hypothetical protein
MQQQPFRWRHATKEEKTATIIQAEVPKETAASIEVTVEAAEEETTSLSHPGVIRVDNVIAKERIAAAAQAEATKEKAADILVGATTETATTIQVGPTEAVKTAATIQVEAAKETAAANQVGTTKETKADI